MAFSYPTQAERFTPASCNMDDPKARLEETVNAYDNSIVDLDASIHRMIALLKNRPAIYFYCSDHGVALGEEGKCSRAISCRLFTGLPCSSGIRTPSPHAIRTWCAP